MAESRDHLKRVLDEWEPAEFADLMDNSVPINFVAEVQVHEETLKEANDAIIDVVAQTVQH